MNGRCRRWSKCQASWQKAATRTESGRVPKPNGPEELVTCRPAAMPRAQSARRQLHTWSPICCSFDQVQLTLRISTFTVLLEPIVTKSVINTIAIILVLTQELRPPAHFTLSTRPAPAALLPAHHHQHHPVPPSICIPVSAPPFAASVYQPHYLFPSLPIQACLLILNFLFSRTGRDYCQPIHAQAACTQNL